MNIIHQAFKTKKVIQFITDLIVYHDYKYYSDLSNNDKAELVALLLEATELTWAHECITQSKNFDHTIRLFQKALSGTREDDDLFIEAIKANAIEYYEKIMEALFKEIQDDYITERNKWLDSITHVGDPDEAYDRYIESLF